ncbi:MAG: 3-oxoacid CoA-transferase subunit A, partial [Chloroflexota bacterium]|nr:3-oxoacid CoA-transferase subunit A [Chloroflexota bacterium]
LIESGMVSRIISPMPFVPDQESAVKKAWESGTVEIDIQPLGILSERLRSGGAGLGGVFLPTGIGTRFQQGKEKRLIDGKEYILEQPLNADFAFIKAQKGDTLGNLIYRGSSRNWGPVMAMASSVCIAEVEEICEPGELDPEKIITQGIFVNRIIQTQ